MDGPAPVVAARQSMYEEVFIAPEWSWGDKARDDWSRCAYAEQGGEAQEHQEQSVLVVQTSAWLRNAGA